MTEDVLKVGKSLYTFLVFPNLPVIESYVRLAEFSPLFCTIRQNEYVALMTDLIIQNYNNK